MTPQQLDAIMRDPASYPHEVVTPIRKIETHISTVWLTGEYAYKIKKAVDFGFVDFSTRDKRCHFCRQEVRLNRRFAPQLYLETVTVDTTGIGGPPENFQVENFIAGKMPECAVKMRQFDPEKVISRLFSAQTALPDTLWDDLAQRLGTFHLDAEPVPASAPWGWPDSVVQPMLDNFPVLFQHFPQWQARLAALERWTRETLTRLRPLLARRRYTGHIRACHGDLHLDNIALIDNALVPFDGIEFNDQFRWIDPVSDLSFLLMDLDHHGERRIRHRLLQQWLYATGDYEALPLLRFYQVYRALVRAKITTLRALQLEASEREGLLAQVAAYVALAEGYTQPPPPFLIVMQGISGSGKSHYAAELAERLGALVISSDRERKRLAGLTPTERPDDPDRLYNPRMNARTYERLHRLTELLLAAGWPVILDATYLKAAHRARPIEIARRLGCPALIFSLEPDVPGCAERIRQRLRTGGDPSDADEAVMRRQAQFYEPPQPDEPALTQTPGAPIDWLAVKRALKLPIQET